MLERKGQDKDTSDSQWENRIRHSWAAHGIVM